MSDPHTIISADDLLAAPDCEEKWLPVPELGPGKAVKIKGMSKLAADQCRARATVDGETKQELMEREWFMVGLIEPALTPAQYEAMKQKSAGLFYGILNGILVESGMAPEVAKLARKAFLPGSG